ncbi:DUF636-domain-containing protein [Massarina eburnea CBS 473.64]|uniref:DUF636-domain-containing protein n=1 Tax=Massarina eburnea CBS 473.64 TaxID=1395130 RepID=A0A6A6S9H0_9PLEO|nr:DUF636-domain-containing protein [Massarina eburnea CBS 473.64]
MSTPKEPNSHHSTIQAPRVVNPRPFPAVTGGCFCTKTRFRLDAPPLFCFACHCSDCQKHTGSVYACFVCVLSSDITYGSTPPKITKTAHSSGLIRRTASCGICGTHLWASGDTSPITSDVKVGTLDHPELMEPDVHSFIESKIPWVGIPDGARTCEGPFDFREYWPKASLKRFDDAVKKYDEEKKEKGDVEETDKTPTAQSPDEKEEQEDDVDDDDEEFERKARETELALLERLEKLTLKLDQQKPESTTNS